ncbi:ComC/BlpC family leader-containing pheromone/bacteriocin [Streptococcus equinus]
MNTKTFEQFAAMTEIQLAAVEGGGMECIVLEMYWVL